MRSIDELNNRHYGQPVFVLGTSGSLDSHDLSKLEGFVTIGSNDILERWIPDYHLLVDGRPTQKMIPFLLRHPEVTVLARERWATAVVDARFTGEVYELQVEPRRDMYFRGPLQQVDNTGHYCVEVAMRMRGTSIPGKIILLGIDLEYPKAESGVQDHFFGQGGERGCKPNFKKVLEQMPRTFEFLKKRKIELVTCSTWDGPLTEILIQRDFGDLIDELRRVKDE